MLAAYRPTGKGRVERQVLIVREHVLAGRHFDSLAELDDTFAGWLAIRRCQVHRTHGQVIAVRAAPDRAALAPLPALPYLVTDRHLRRVGKDCLISFAASLYSLPARRVRAGQLVEVRAATDTIAVHALPGSQPGGQAATGELVLAVHPRAAARGSWVIDPAHWDGLPDGHTRATTADPPRRGGDPDRTDPTDVNTPNGDPNPLRALLTRSQAAATPVARRPLSTYDNAAGLPAATPTSCGDPR